MYDTILVPTDGSQTAMAAVETALAVATRFEADLHVLAVTHPEADDHTASDDAVPVGTPAVDHALDAATGRNVSAESTVVETHNPVHEAIIEVTCDRDVDLVVMGTHGRSGIDRLRVGSVTERTIRDAEVPVMTVRADASAPAFDGILAPSDGSEHAQAAVDHAAELSAATGGTLSLLSVVDSAVMADWDANVGTILESLQDAREEALAREADRIEAAGATVGTVSVQVGQPSRAILEAARDPEIDLLVMGSHGRSGLSRLLLGSVTERVLRAAPIPVIVTTQERSATTD